MKYKTGLNRSPEPPRIKFGEYLQAAVLPPVPPAFGHYNLVSDRGWGMLANDRIGDCTVAGAMHACLLFNQIAGKAIRFTDLDAEDDYAAITGWNEANKQSDTGADMVEVARYWQQTGFRDAMANRHRILAYMQVDARNLSHIDAACYLFDAVGFGITIGSGEENAFQRGRPWVRKGTVEGYHYVPMVGKDANYRYVVTWGGLQQVSESWLQSSLSEVVAIISNENLIAGKSLEGFDIDALMGDLEAL